MDKWQYASNSVSLLSCLNVNVIEAHFDDTF